MSLPPGQSEAKEWYVRTALPPTEIDLGSWRLEVKGLVKRSLSLSYSELLTMPQFEVKGGFHCVEGWSVTWLVWEGPRIRDVAGMAGVLEDARWVMFRSAEGYSAIASLEDALAEDSIIALRVDGKPLSKEHGFPARPVIPRIYAWKSVKWLKEMEFLRDYVDGFYEERGYHERGNVWLEERRKNR